MRLSTMDLDALRSQDRFVRGIARSLVADRHGAEDLAQTAWGLALTAPVAARGPLGAWLAGAVRRLAWKSFRSDERRLRRERQAARPEGVPSAAEILEREALRQRVVRAVLDLPEPSRTPVLLRYFEELPPRAIARRLGIPVETVRTRIKRGIGQLRQVLESDAKPPGRGGSPALSLGVLAAACRPGGLISALAAAAAPATGVLVMTLKVKIVIAVVVLSAAGFLAWRPTEEDEGARPVRLPEAAAAPAISDDPAPVPDEPPPPAVAVAAKPEAPPADPPAAPLPPPAEVDPYGALDIWVVWAADQKPAAGVPMYILPFGGTDPFFHEIRDTTDAAGRLRIDRIHSGGAHVEACFGGTTRTKIEAGKTTEVKLEIPRGATVEGIVVDSVGRPVAAAGIVLGSGGGSTDGPIVTLTGADGTFRIRDLDAKNFRNIGARAPGFAPSPMAMVHGNPGGTVNLRLVLPGPGGELRGRVVDPAGDPVARARVRIGDDSYKQHVQPDGLRATSPGPQIIGTDAEGRFHAVGLAVGEVPVQVRAAGLAPWTGSASVAATPGPELVVSLGAGAVLRGRITDDAGAPQAKVEIQINGYGNLLSSYARTAADGTFRLEGLASGEIKVKAEADGQGKSEATLKAGPGEEIVWNAVLKTGGSIRGKLLDIAGLPLSGWSIGFEFMETGQWDHKWVETDAEGRFEAKDCLDVEYTASVKAPKAGGMLLRQKGKVRPGAEEIVIRLAEDLRPTCWIQGAVHGGDGLPLGGVQISYFREGENGGPIELTKEKTGAFEFGPLAPGIYSISIHARGYAPWRSGKHELKAESNWDLGAIVLSTPGTLAVVLKSPEGVTGDPPMVTVSRAEPRVYDHLAVEGGVARSGPLDPGSYTFRISGNRWVTRELPVEIRAGEETRTEVDLEAAAPVEIRILEAGVPAGVRSARITVRDGTGTVVAGAEVRRSRESGFRTAFGLRPASYRVEATTDVGLMASGTLSVDRIGGEPVILELKLR